MARDDVRAYEIKLGILAALYHLLPIARVCAECTLSPGRAPAGWILPFLGLRVT